MKAGVVYGPRDIKVEEVEMPSPGPRSCLRLRRQVSAAAISTFTGPTLPALQPAA
jgi:hypothetical protein